MAYHTRFVNIDPLRGRSGAHNAGAWERAFYDVIFQQGGGLVINISGSAPGDKVTLDGTLYEDGVDFAGAADAAGLAGAINAASGPDLVAVDTTVSTVLVTTATTGRTNAQLLADFGALVLAGGITLFKVDGVTPLSPALQLNVFDGLDGIITTIVTPSGATIVLTEGVDWNVGATLYESMVEWLIAVAGATGSPLQIELMPDVLSTTPVTSKLAARQFGRWGTDMTVAITGANANQVKLNTVAGPHGSGQSPVGGGLLLDAGEQMAAALNALSPAPASIADIIIRPCNPDFTQWMIAWEG